MLLFISCASIWPCFCRNSTLFCREEERDALIKILQSLSDPLGLLLSWKGKDCCKWQGISCNAATRHVVRLELLPRLENRSDGSIPVPDHPFYAVRLSSYLLNLKHLNHLDLTGINVDENCAIPDFIGSMKQIRYLNLSNMGFHGTVPSHLGNLTNLEVLDLRNSPQSCPTFFNYVSSGDDLQWVSRLVALKHLDISGVDLSKVHNLMQVLSMLPSLSRLSLSCCRLDNFHLSPGRGLNSSFLSNLRYLDLSNNYLDLSSPFQNLTSLNYLDLSYNSFNSLGSHFLSGPNLEHLDISRNQFRGQIPRALQNMTSLTYLDLSNNGFSSVPMWFSGLKCLIHMDISGNPLGQTVGGLSLLLRDKCNLRFLNLDGVLLQGQIIGKSSGFCAPNLESLSAGGNLFEGKLPDQLGNLENLKYLTLSRNFFNGSIPDSWGKLRSLLKLDLSSNFLYGAIPWWLGQLQSLQSLDVRDNDFSGTISESLGQLSDLQYLDFSGNSLEGSVSEVHLANLSRLESLDLSNNHLTVKIKSDWVLPFHLTYIAMRSCKFDTRLPQWLRTQNNAGEIILSNASISGELPEWLGNWIVFILDLSHNQITGPLSKLSRFIGYSLDLSHNQISGQIPATFGNISVQSSLFLNDNLITGPIPASLCEYEGLELDLSGNKLSGNIPDCWNKSSAPLHMNKINLSSNNLSGLISSSMGKLSSLLSLHLNDNNLRGELPTALRFLTNLVFLDLGENNLSGYLPSWIAEDLQSLKVLKLRNNHFNGSIPLKFCSLSQLKWLDLASNRLSGTIPTCFGYLRGMTWVSYTHPGNSSAIAETPTVVDKAPTAGIMKGNELEYITTDIQSVSAMDLSGNNLEGSIPKELASLMGLRSLNLSHNLLSGNIPQNIGDLKVVESLDVSNNRLSGHIPLSISNLTFLARLDSSNNNFSGRPPKGNQLDTLYTDNPFMYAGNPQLCGDPLPNRCPGDKVPEPPNTPGEGEEGKESDSSERIVFYGVVATGFATGFWGVIGILIFKKNWRVTFFRFVEKRMDGAYVAIMVKVAKLKRRMRRT
ncbi:hypothetical protein CDL15_Pgr027966 [Punica granatum]|uniref:Uncharacterized protein n=1 Tax=Punica granatum TaxID=22663 RepID=A0A218XKG5_PUNGR|nr:hypothetical protein CDL15_Pgr027966 [Punica granatum]